MVAIVIAGYLSGGDALSGCLVGRSGMVGSAIGHDNSHACPRDFLDKHLLRGPKLTGCNVAPIFTRRVSGGLAGLMLTAHRGAARLAKQRFASRSTA